MLPVSDVTASVEPSSRGTTSPWRSVDGTTDTSWATWGGAPDRATLTIDLGSVQAVSGVKWVYNRSDGIDRQILQVSTDGSEWQQMVVTSARYPLQWEGVAVDRDVRYVRLVLTNDPGLPVVGYVAEVQVWGAPATATTLAAVGGPSMSIAAAEAPTEAPAPESAPAATTSWTGYVSGTNGDALNCRAEPSTGGEIIAKLPPGTAVTIAGGAENGWLPALCSGMPGWVSADFISDTAPPAEEPTAVPTEAPAAETEASVAQTAPAVREIVIPVSVDLSVAGNEPDTTEAPPGDTLLAIGGEKSYTTALTFDIAGVDGGTITSAVLVVNGLRDGRGGEIDLVTGYRVDPWGSTWNGLSASGAYPAGWLDWITAGGQATADLTGWIPKEGTVTLLMSGSASQTAGIASQESGSGPVLVLTVEN